MRLEWQVLGFENGRASVLTSRRKGGGESQPFTLTLFAPLRSTAWPRKEHNRNLNSKPIDGRITLADTKNHVHNPQSIHNIDDGITIAVGPPQGIP